MEQGDFTYPLAAIGKDEVARVTRAFEGMRNTLERNEAQRQQHVTELKQLHLGTLTALARAIDAKSHWTAGHSERVTSWAVKIASERTGASKLEKQAIEGQERAKVQRTFWLQLVVLLHLLAIISAALMYWIDQRGEYRPLPKIELLY